MSEVPLPTVAPLLVVAALLGCGHAESESSSSARARSGVPPPSEHPFVEVTEAAGVEFLHDVGDGLMDNIIESLGSGAAWFDADGDGDLDLYLVNQGWSEGVSSGEGSRNRVANRLFSNRGDGVFEDVTERAGVADEGYGYAAAGVDLDNDGDQDLVVVNCGENRVYRNRGDGRFDDITATSGLSDRRCSAGVTLLDYDLDGLLDVYVANYLEFDPEYQIHYAPDVYPGPLAYQAQPDALYRNRGDGSFEDVTAATGIDRIAARAMGVATSDFDGDGRMDLFVANDASENYLFRNLGGRFEETAIESGTAYGFYGEATGAMAGAIGDLDQDGLPDILVTDTAYGSLYHNLGEGLFEDRVMASGLADVTGQWVSWGGGFFDYDNDGDLDVFQVNGDLKRPTGRPDLLLENDGQGRFAEVAGGPYFERELLGRGGAFADFDEDGDVDVLITVLDGPPVLLRNDLVNTNHWLELELVGVHCNRDAIGARVVVIAGERRWMRIRDAGTGYVTQSSPRLHFGLGGVTRIDRIEVTWPGGATEVFEQVAVDGLRTLVQGKGR